eukprot:87633_1
MMIYLFFFVLDNQFAYINFIIILFISFFIDLCAFLKWYWKINDPKFFITSLNGTQSDMEKNINFLYAQTPLIQNENRQLNINNKMHIPSIPNLFTSSKNDNNIIFEYKQNNINEN